MSAAAVASKSPFKSRDVGAGAGVFSTLLVDATVVEGLSIKDIGVEMEASEDDVGVEVATSDDETVVDESTVGTTDELGESPSVVVGVGIGEPTKELSTDDARDGVSTAIKDSALMELDEDTTGVELDENTSGVKLDDGNANVLVAEEVEVTSIMEVFEVDARYVELLTGADSLASQLPNPGWQPLPQ
ncbi:hypothetical protein HBH56_187150 [Parastagonospora nodorum]|nr:hypothetical protein HBH56_187150 [Parastagonospora nodorum]KAH3925278.1 hypothetical protein HBH54_181410 [Parastagonospora nodorum]KAH3991035.1 hypothetical protein HBI10_238410 [Parastagonospora nodorum]KAH4008340.1 hypothetical protein HBI13_238650 [Parastagonospora nodorum]KAH4055925.1 hypothetical protein HBH50_241990 [Parastagonospora nodorum]